MSDAVSRENVGVDTARSAPAFFTRAELKVKAADGFDLDATLYEPKQDNGIAIQINSATATPRRFYAAFAEYMAQRGFAVLTYDYRGAVSHPGSLARNSPASLLAWGGHDQPAVTGYLRRRYPRHALALIGHSVGGQITALSQELRLVTAILIIASGHGYWRKIPDPARRRRRAWHVHVTGPLALRLFGYLPGFAIGGGAAKGPLHSREFLRFSRSPHFFCDADGSPLRPFGSDFHGLLKQIMPADDDVAAPGAGFPARDCFPNAALEFETLRPADFGLETIGHFGFFRRAMEPAWTGVADWLQKACRKPVMHSAGGL
jgi:predicted alpha/beta hydrolase